MMKKIWIFLIITLMSITAFADIDLLKNQIKQQYPHLDFQNIQSTEMKGIYSANMDGQIVYLDETGQYVLLGNMIRLKDQTNLTKNLINRADWNSLPFKNAIKIIKGNGQHQLAIFSDPNCPYCQKLEKQLTQLTDVTLYIFIYPLQPASIAVSKQIWCSPSASFAWQNLMQQKLQPKPTEVCDNPIQDNLNLGWHLKFEGTPGIIFKNGMKLTGYLSKDEILKIWKENNL